MRRTTDQAAARGPDHEDLARTLLAENYQRLTAIAYVGSSVNLVAAAIALGLGAGPEPSLLIRALWIAASLGFALYARLGRRRPARERRIVFLGAAALSLLLSAMLAFRIAGAGGQSLVFVINALLSATFLVLPLPEALLAFAPAVLYLVATAFLGAEGGSYLERGGRLINLAATVAFSLMIASFRAEARRKAFLYEREIARANSVLADLAELDGLTGIPNRRKCETFMASLQALASREGMDVAAVMLDLDDFKAYNDRYGHLSGDELLVAAARAMKAALPRESDFLCRYGGEEFLALLPSTDLEGARLVAERLRGAVAGLGFEHETRPSRRASVSAGCAAGAPDRERGLLDVVRRADAALYEAKRGGKDRVALADAAGAPRAD